MKQFSTLLLFSLLFACKPTQKTPLKSIEPLAQRSAIEAKTKDMTAYPGYFPFWWDDREGKIWLEISRLDKEFLYVNSLPSGVGSNDIGLDRGQLGNTRVVKFVRSGNKILLIQPNLAYRASSTNPIERRTVEESFAQSVLWGFPIAQQDGGRFLLDFTPFLLHDAHDVAGTLARSNQGNYAPDPNRCAVYLDRTKNFPKNSEWEAIITFAGKAQGEYIRTVTPTPNAVTVRIHHSFIELPDNQYKPRRFDPRSGYFETSWYDYSVPIGEPITQRYIVRHRLQKKDPTATLSDPVKPIVYYMDPGVPEPVKSALMDGARWWNQAFEAAGYRNAFLVKELPADADPMDVRYNTVQWVHRSTRGWSYGATVSDPRTGEIIKGHVSLGSLRVRQDYLIAQGLRSPFDDERQFDPESEEMALARLRQLSAHEIGHTLGLAHNFAASTNGRASVMDYPHPYIQLKADSTLDFSQAYDNSIGNWDKRAILFGYQDFPPGTDENKALDAIISENIRQNLLHISDEGARPPASAHPFASLWDNGTNPAAELRRLNRIRDLALGRFGEKSIPKGRIMSDLERVLVPLYLARRYQVEATVKNIGGVIYAYAKRGDGQAPTLIVPESSQKSAFEALLETLSPAQLELPERIMRSIPPQPIGFDRDRELFKSNTGGFFDPLSAAASSADHTLGLLLLPERLNRVLEQQARDALTTGFNLERLFAQLSDTLFPAKTSLGLRQEIRHQVQHLYLKHLLTLTQSDVLNPTVKGYVLMEVNTLEERLKKRQSTTQFLPEKAQLNWLLNQIATFRLRPGDFKVAPSAGIPPGQPIGCGEE